LSGPLLLALTSGLLGGLGHCAAMCGPLVASLGLGARQAGLPRALAGQALYHAGRITTYASVGAAMGLTGSFVNTAGRLAGLQDAVGVVAGALMIVMGLGATGVLPRARAVEERLAGRLFRAVRALVEGGGMGRYYALGIALGFLPCGLSYSAFVGAAGTGGLPQGLLFALVFGVATVPALLLVGVAAAALSARVRDALYRLGGFAIVAAGVLFLLRGLGRHAQV
jgi:sulfite exporter TauE/SafE